MCVTGSPCCLSGVTQWGLLVFQAATCHEAVAHVTSPGLVYVHQNGAASQLHCEVQKGKSAAGPGAATGAPCSAEHAA